MRTKDYGKEAMKIRHATIFGSFVGLLFIAVIGHAQDGPTYSHTGSTIISGIRVIDGLGNDPVESVHSQAKLSAVARQLNELPRKTLDFETPADRFKQCVASTG